MAGRRSVGRLRPLRPADLEPLSRWLPQTAAELGCERLAGVDALQNAVRKKDLLALDEPGTGCVVSYESGAPEPEAASIRLLAVEPQRRRLGAGTRAVLALERRLRREVRRIYVAVPATTGLAFYFWLRLGYRPLTQREWPETPGQPPAAWLVRDLR